MRDEQEMIKKLSQMAEDAENHANVSATDHQRSYWKGVSFGFRRAITVVQLGL
jgi:hypothetical protein